MGDSSFEVADDGRLVIPEIKEEVSKNADKHMGNADCRNC